MAPTTTQTNVAETMEADGGLIALMSQTLSNQIAAGEVVQRPASVAKELMENALDAGASSVSLLVRTAGSSLVQVIDDGCGMNAVDAARAFERHATSKLRRIEDLGALHTYGFRGEALASVASVAQVELRTKRRHDALGTLVRIDGNALEEIAPCATADGTSIAVRNLFYNVPARRNFLKSPSTEFKHLVETFQRMALANPQVGFTLVQDDHEVFRLPGSEAPFLAALPERMAGLLGADYQGHVIPVEEATSYVSVRGLLGDPSLFRRSRGDQFLFVNGRFIKDRSLDYAARAAYEAMLPSGSHPAYALFVDIDPKHVDVNVHPAKSEVKFDDERGVFAFVKSAVQRALAGHLVAPDSGKARAKQGESDADAPRAAPSPMALRSASTPAARSASPSSAASPGASRTPFSAGRDTSARGLDGLETSALLYGGEAETSGGEPRDAAQTAAALFPEPSAEGAAARSPDEMSATWRHGERYIGAALPSSVLVVDVAAAHQRIVYERALATMERETRATQHLLFPITVDFDAATHALVTEALGELTDLGFELARFSGRAFVLSGVPPDVRSGEERRVLLDCIEHLKEPGGLPQSDRRKAIARVFARYASLADASGLDDLARRTLIADLFACEMPYAAPNGATTCFRLTIEEMASRLG